MRLQNGLPVATGLDANYNLVIYDSMKAKELRKFRIVLGLTQAGLAKAVGVTPNAIALAERGERGISEPLGRLVKLLAQIHTGELMLKRRSIKGRSR